MTRSIVTDPVASPMSVATAIFAFAGAVPRFWMTNVVSQPSGPPSIFVTFGKYTVVGDAACACAAGVMSGNASDSASASEITRRSDLVECPSIVPLPSAPAHGRSRARSRDERRSRARAGPPPRRRDGDGSKVRRATQVLARRLASGLQWPGPMPVNELPPADAPARRSPEYLAAIVDSSDDAIIGKTLDGTIVSWNPGAERLYGYTPDEMIGRPNSIIVPAEHPDELPQILDRLRRGERIEHYRTTRVTKDGERITVSVTISPVRDASGTIIGASAIARDVGEHERAVQ